MTIDSPTPERSGVPLLDEPGRHACVVRASYAMGTGPQRSDIEGFALRLEPGERHTAPVDLLFASTGEGPVSRFALSLRRPGQHGTQTTLLPIDAGRPLLLRLEPVDADSDPWPAAYDISWAHGGGGWHTCGRLAVEWTLPTDVPARFDPTVNKLPGTTQYPVARWLREPSYVLARRAWPRAGSLPATPGKESL